MRGVIFREKSGLFKTVTKTIVCETLFVSTMLTHKNGGSTLCINNDDTELIMRWR